MAKIKIIKDDYDGIEYSNRRFSFACEGCGAGAHHVFFIKGEGGNHTFNMDLENPTVTPSLFFSNNGIVCNCEIKDGNIRYLDISNHEFSGKTLALKDIE